MKKQVVPSDDECLKAWNEIVAIAEKHALIASAYGGVMTLVMPGEQRKAGMRDAVLQAHEMREE